MKLNKKNKKLLNEEKLKIWAEQFKNLDTRDPTSWPFLPKALLFLVTSILTVVLAWFLYLSSFEEELTAAKEQEISLRSVFEERLKKAVNLEGLKRQREQVQVYVTELEKQLPNKSEIAALLTDINQAGLGRNLKFEMFKPGQEVVKNYYAELPIAVRISGNFHDIGMFASDITFLSRIVNLNNLEITPKVGGGGLVFNAVAQTYRFLDAGEAQAVQKAGAK